LLIPRFVLATFVFRHFFDGLALAGAVAEWSLACWLLGIVPSPVWHVVVPLTLAVVNRRAAHPLEHECSTGIFAGRAGHVVLATAFGALTAAAVLVTFAAAWGAVGLLGAITAEASGRVAVGPVPIFAGAFRWIATLAVALTGVAVVDGYTRGYRRLVLTSVTVPLAGLAHPLRIVHLTDLHVGPLADRDALRDAFDRANALEPDLVCVTGDLVDSPAADLDAWIPELARVRAPHGVFAILGNHDALADADGIADALARFTTWRLLRDEIATVDVGDIRINLAGLEDRFEKDPRERLAALLARLPAGEPAILLMHRPDAFTSLAAKVGLVLAGHTHGGQLAVPGLPRLNMARLLQSRFDLGTFAHASSVLHVNRGLGTAGQRIRIGAPREISVVTVVPADQAMRQPPFTASSWPVTKRLRSESRNSTASATSAGVPRNLSA